MDQADISKIFDEPWDGVAGFLAAVDRAGLAIVPKEPTEAMLKAAFAKMNETPSGHWKALKAQKLSPRQLFDAKMLPRWRAMVERALRC